MKNFLNHIAKQVSLLTLLVGFSQLLNAQTTQTFNASGTYIVPVGKSCIVKIEAWGGGGGGNYGGGGGGAYAAIDNYTLTAGSYTVTVGAGGAGAVASTSAGVGGASSFTTLVIAAGGSATPNSNIAGAIGGQASASTGDVKHSGGNGANAVVVTSPAIGIGGGGGGSATATTDGGNGNTNGTGGTGEGAGGGGTTSTDAFAGTAPGGGGGGSYDGPNTNGLIAQKGGAGAAGRVIVTVISVLPVEFGAISPVLKDGALTVVFTTLTETNNSHFDVEVSKDGKTFAKAATIKSKSSNGMSNTPTNYSVIIPQPGLSLLGITVFSLCALMAIFFSRKNKWLMGLCLVFGMGFFGASCQKGGGEVASKNGASKLFVRIAQYDIDNSVNYSKVYQVVSE